jgi:DNA-binding transcriptional LysR family regulator
MRTEQLVYLIEISKTNSITLAAKRLFIAQQTLSQSIQSLENELNTQILIRTNKGVRLTKKGEIILQRAKNIMLEVNAIQLELNCGERIKSFLNGKLNVSISPHANWVLSPRALPVFCKKHPQVNLNIYEKSNVEIVSDIINKKIRLGIISTNKDFLKNTFIAANIDSLDINALFYDELLILVSKNSPLSKKKSISLKNITKYPLALNNTKHLPFVLPKEEKFNIFIDTNSTELYLKAIEENLAIGFSTKSIAKNSYFSINKNIIPIPITNGFLLQIDCVTKKNTPLAANEVEFLKIIQTVC